MLAWCPPKSEEGVGSPEVELQTVVNYHAGGGEQTQSSARAASALHPRAILSSPMPLAREHIWEVAQNPKTRPPVLPSLMPRDSSSDIETPGNPETLRNSRRMWALSSDKRGAIGSDLMATGTKK